MPELVPAGPVSPEELKRRLDARDEIVLLDVRTPEEFADWHIRGAWNVPLHELASRVSEVPKGREVVTVCAHGVRSGRAAAFLSKAGFRARNLRGGMVGWNAVYDVAVVPVGDSLRKTEVLQFRRVGKGCLSYLVAGGGEAVVVDATVDIDVFLEAARARGLRIVAAVDTHAHADHASGGRAIAGRLDVPYRAPREAGPGAEPIAEGSGLRIGPAEIRAIATPGHTTGHVTLLFDHVAFTGDTLFLDSVGRPDLGQDARENAAVLWETLHRRILSLPDNTTILPAHFGDGIVLAPGVPLEDSLRDLKAAIPTLRLGREEFVDFVARGTDRPPANFQRIKAHNVGSARIEDVDEIRELEAGPNRCAVK